MPHTTEVNMACVFVSYKLPNYEEGRELYERWMVNRGLEHVMKLQGLKEVRSFRDLDEENGKVSAMPFFESLADALKIAGSNSWQHVMANFSAFGIDDVQLTFLKSSPLVPSPMIPNQMAISQSK